MQANDDSGAVFQGPAHGTLIMTQRGEWFVSYHAFELSHYSLGRQMCLDPIEWMQDGWWQPIGGRIPSIEAPAPDLPAIALKFADSDEFDSPKLGLQWFFHTTPDMTGKSWSLQERPGHLRIHTMEGDISSPSSLPNVFLQRVTAKCFEFSTRVEFDARGGGEAAGLHMYHDPGMNFWLVTTAREGTKVFEVGRYSNGKRETLWTEPNKIGNCVHLKIAVDGEENASFHYGPDGRQWKKIGEEIYFGDSWQDLRNGKRGNPDLGWVGLERRNVWSAATMGIFAVRDGAVSSKNADFDFFRVEKKY